MDNKNYIVINGKKTELTQEQLKALGIEAPKPDIFNRTKEGKFYHYIDSAGEISSLPEEFSGFDTNRYNVANYCTNLEVMGQRALHETLNRLLWRFSMEHDGEKIDWKDYSQRKYFIRVYSHLEYDIGIEIFNRIGTVYFYTKEIAEQAIDEVVKPFMAEHPNFKW